MALSSPINSPHQPGSWRCVLAGYTAARVHVRVKPVCLRASILSQCLFCSCLFTSVHQTCFCKYVAQLLLYLAPPSAVELAMIMDRLYGGVCYAGIDTDPELKYPKGAGRVAFSNQQSYIAAISARFVQLQHGEIDKRVSVWVAQCFSGSFLFFHLSPRTSLPVSLQPSSPSSRFWVVQKREGFCWKCRQTCVVLTRGRVTAPYRIRLFRVASVILGPWLNMSTIQYEDSSIRKP